MLPLSVSIMVFLIQNSSCANTLCQEKKDYFQGGWNMEPRKKVEAQVELLVCQTKAGKKMTLLFLWGSSL